MTKQIFFASTNQHKVKEINNIFKPYGFEILPLDNKFTTNPPQENGLSFFDNSKLKACYYSSLLKEPVLADDSGLCVTKLDNKPGIFSSRFAGENSCDQDNNYKLLEEMNKINDDRSAKFVCSLSLAIKGKFIHQETGEVSGIILNKSVGKNGFGYDPLFFHCELKKTFAQMSSSEKNKISHRNQACNKMLNFFKNWNYTT